MSTHNPAAQHPAPPPAAGDPRPPADRLLAPLARFLHVEAAGGVVLLAMTVVALVLANSPAAPAFLSFWKTPVGIRVGGFELVHPLKHWINDGLMALFFFVVGLEVKREVVLGELRDRRAAALPVVAALGGMAAPAAIYLMLQGGQPGARGWGIPMATDIAFVVGCLAVLGARVPLGLRVLLLSLAIADDIGAVLVIAIGYTDALDLRALGWGLAGLAGIVALSRLGIRAFSPFIVLGTLVWFAFHQSGVHATVAGVLLGFLTPARPWPGRERVSPLQRLETALHPWVSFAIMPVFALANAGVPIAAQALGHPVAVAVMAGLLLGKPLGIVAFSWLAVRLNAARLPAGVGWRAMAAGGVLGGIGFTMALFIAGLALQAQLLEAAKLGILAASAVAALAGLLGLRIVLPPRAAAEPATAVPAG